MVEWQHTSRTVIHVTFSSPSTETGLLGMAASAPAQTALAEAFDKLKSSVSAGDAVNFQSTSLQDVWKAARDIERLQQQRQSVRNLRRIEPLLNAIGKYSKVIEVLCNGTPYLPWIWVSLQAVPTSF